MPDTEKEDSLNKDNSVSFDWEKVVVFGVLAIIVLIVIFFFSSSDDFDTDDLSLGEQTVEVDLKKEINDSSEQISEGGDEMTVNELIIEDIVVGDGAEAVSGKTITVHYTGTLTDGTKFDSSLDRGVPFTFDLGAGRVIEGWDKGFAGMKVGGVRKLTIPGDMAYGPSGTSGIPPNATLIFEVQLLEVE